jgi:hypothetical protein
MSSNKYRFTIKVLTLGHTSLLGKQGTQREKVTKGSFAWGQWLVGSVLSGFAVWKLTMKLLQWGVSTVLAGVAAIYEQAREFITFPLDLLHIPLSDAEKNCVVICLVLVGAVLRAMFRDAEFVRPFFRSFWTTRNLLLLGGLTILFFIPYWIFLRSAEMQIRIWIWICVLASIEIAVVFPLLGISYVRVRPRKLAPPDVLQERGIVHVSPHYGLVLASRENRRRAKLASMKKLVLFNILGTGFWGSILMLLNSATS